MFSAIQRAYRLDDDEWRDFLLLDKDPFQQDKGFRYEEIREMPKRIPNKEICRSSDVDSNLQTEGDTASNETSDDDDGDDDELIGMDDVDQGQDYKLRKEDKLITKLILPVDANSRLPGKKDFHDFLEYILERTEREVVMTEVVTYILE